MKSLLIAPILLAVVLPATAAEDFSHLPDHIEICIGCHGPKGNVIYNNAPVLAKQHEDALFYQLLAIKQGARDIPEMNDFISQFSEVQLRDAAQYFHSQAVQPPSEELYCAGCHSGESSGSYWDVEEPHG